MVFIDNVEDLRLLLPALAIIIWLYWLWTRRHWYRFSLRFPTCWGLPLFGVFLSMKHVNYIISSIGEMFHKYGQYNLCVWVGFYPALLTADPEIIETVLTSTELLGKAQPYYGPLHHVFRGGLITSEVEKWTHNRKLLNPCFKHNVLLSFFSIFNKAKKTLEGELALLVDNKEHNFFETLTKVSVGMTLETTMGRIKKDEDHDYKDIVANLAFLMRTVSMKGFLTFLKLDGIFHFYRKYNKTREYFRMVVGKLVEKRINDANSNRTSTKDSEMNEENVAAIASMKKAPTIFIDQAIQLYQKGLFSWNDIISESSTTAAAASETTANAIFSSLVFLAMHPDYQERLFEELVNVFPEKTFEVEYEHLQQLPYLDMVINETLRLTPPIPLIGRHVVKDTQLREGLTVPKDMQIFISIFHMHRRTDIWGPNASRFNPDHFLPENLSKIHTQAFVPFSSGRRKCIGWRYAEYAMKVLLCGLIRNYRFTTDFTYGDMQFTHHIAMRYVKEPPLKVFNRE